MTMFYV